MPDQDCRVKSFRLQFSFPDAEFMQVFRPLLGISNTIAFDLNLFENFCPVIFQFPTSLSCTFLNRKTAKVHSDSY